ncbi:hypothetical protein ABE10_03005, partial [Bacillus toyonensis]|nr:hypothetical protein [Bacillus toyonensis]
GRERDVQGHGLLVAGRDRVVQRLDDRLLQPVHQHDRHVALRAEVRGVVDRDLVLDVAVVPLDAHHQDREHGDGEEDHPRAMGELGDRDDQEHRHGHGGAQRVDDEAGVRRAPLPRRL